MQGRREGEGRKEGKRKGGREGGREGRREGGMEEGGEREIRLPQVMLWWYITWCVRYVLVKLTSIPTFPANPGFLHTTLREAMCLWLWLYLGQGQGVAGHHRLQQSLQAWPSLSGSLTKERGASPGSGSHAALWPTAAAIAAHTDGLQKTALPPAWGAVAAFYGHQDLGKATCSLSFLCSFPTLLYHVPAINSPPFNIQIGFSVPL